MQTTYRLSLALGVAFLSFLTQFIKFFNERSIGARSIKKLKDYIDIYSTLPENINAKEDIAALIKKETGRMLVRSSRRMNIPNIVIGIILATSGGALSYFFVLWAINSSSILLSIFLWMAFSVVFFFTMSVSIFGLISMYEELKYKTKR